MGEKVGDLVAERYRLVALLGEGGMGSAWRARDERLQRDVAVKQLNLPPGRTDEVRARRVAWMEREARTAGMLRHQGIVTVYDQVADALAAAHAAGVVHRDIKPADILLDGDRAVVTDFGVAALDGATTITPTGAIIGTPAYMSPEQLHGGEATPAGDMWSLGATLYFAVEGRPAFTGPNTAALLLAVSRGKPTSMVHAGPLQPVLRDLLNKNPARRLPATPAVSPRWRSAAMAGCWPPPMATEMSGCGT